ncbi:NADH kinase pos5 [Agyrium rufum]|nr:NADH kinase pos5 [Agyrium rufum]
MARIGFWTSLRSSWGEKRTFSQTCRHCILKDISELPNRTQPLYQETKKHDLLTLEWPKPPRNILLVKKDFSQPATNALLEFAKHIHTTYPSLSIICEPRLSESIHDNLSFPIYTLPNPASPFNAIAHTSILRKELRAKTDLIVSFGGDGTILHASSLFSTSASVPPILSFSMGTLGFLTAFPWSNYAQVFDEAYKARSSSSSTTAASSTRVLLRPRLRVLFPEAPARSAQQSDSTSTPHPIHALNELLLHRASAPHLTHITITLRLTPSSPPQTLTTAISDGILLSTPTGSTAYSLSAGGSIIHPLVPCLLLTPICARSLSFRPLVLPETAEVRLRVEGREKGGRGGGAEVSVDGVRMGGEGNGDGKGLLRAGQEVIVKGEEVVRGSREEGGWKGGVPCLVEGSGSGAETSGRRVGDGWVGGLNGLLKFNYPFGDDVG